MFGFNLRRFAETAINSITGTSQNDEEIAKLVKEVESQDSSFANLLSITKELEKQLLTFAETNSSILCHMEKLEDKANKNGEKVDVWGTASHFYYSIGMIKDEVYPEINDTLLTIRGEVGKRGEMLHDLRGRESAYNTKQSAIADDEDLLKQLKSRDELISLHGDAHSDMVAQTRAQMSKLKESIDADKAKQAEEKTKLVTSLHDLIASNRSFIEDALHTLYELFASIYASMSKTFSSEVPASILDLTQPLFPNQPDKELRFTLSAGNMQEHPISVTNGSCVKWMFRCDDPSVRFSVVLTTAQTKEVVVEKEHKVKGDGRYDVGEMVSDRDGVVTLVWDNTYSLITSRQVVGRIAVKHPVKRGEGVKGVKEEEKPETEEVKSETKDGVEEEKKEEVIEEKKEEKTPVDEQKEGIGNEAPTEIVEEKETNPKSE